MNADMSTLTRRYTDEAIQFIQENEEKPFFLYLAHTMPHTKLAASDDFKGKSVAGLYGDVIEEIDYNVGSILDELKKSKLDQNTYVIFTSDNGPWWIKNDHGGSALPLRGAKTSAWEGGLRVPCIMWAPGKIPAGTSSDLVTATIDLLPSIAKIAGASPPSDRVIDGLDISNVIHGRDIRIGSTLFLLHASGIASRANGKTGNFTLSHQPDSKAIGYTKWPRHVSPEDRVSFDENTLYNLEKDIGETTNVAVDYPEIVAELLRHLEWAKKDIGDFDGRGEKCPTALETNLTLLQMN